MVCLPQMIDEVFNSTYTTGSFCMAAMSSGRVGAVSALPWCVLTLLCNTTHVKTMSDNL